MKPYGERRAEGIREQNETYRRLSIDFPRLTIINDNSGRKHVDFEVHLPDGHIEPIEHKAWSGKYLMRIRHYLNTRPKFRKRKGGIIHFTNPQEESPDAKIAMDKDQRTRTHGYTELRNMIHNLTLRHPRAAYKPKSPRRGFDGSLMRRLPISNLRLMQPISVQFGAYMLQLPTNMKPLVRQHMGSNMSNPDLYDSGEVIGSIGSNLNYGVFGLESGKLSLGQRREQSKIANRQYWMKVAWNRKHNHDDHLAPEERYRIQREEQIRRIAIIGA